MSNKQTPRDSLEERLRRDVPPLRMPDHNRVAKACVRVASAPSLSLSPLRQSHTFTRPLARIAACALLLFGVAVLVRRQPHAAVPSLPPLPSITTVLDMSALLNTPAFDNALAGEASGLASDLTDLTAALNARTLAILF